MVCSVGGVLISQTTTSPSLSQGTQGLNTLVSEHRYVGLVGRTPVSGQARLYLTAMQLILQREDALLN